MLTKKQKVKRAIPGIIVGIFMIGIITWGILGDKRCKKLIRGDDCVQQVVFVSIQKKHSGEAVMKYQQDL